MNGTTEVPQEYDQRDMFFFVHAGTPQVDTVGVADPIETKTKPEVDPDAYLGRLSGRAAPSSEVPEVQLGEQGQERKKVVGRDY
ncbi:hypothetical protein L1987_45951 [Smallanthus sonchifolius]|uniref:Uncharacterized protein n=1 Tax=Smallanthus sonchifolius TaxID=185202 RepID=A0ACB9FZE3_9ASTR|nr:hypothetical protein L1987_45951 [Smallanthus sonchifolius]